jgi:hypothetical protein
LHREIATERQYLHRELGGYAPLLKKCRIQTPDLIERAALSEETHKALRAYADFRHLFRHGYLDQLNWELMADAVHGIPATLERVEADLDRFLAALKEDN